MKILSIVVLFAALAAAPGQASSLSASELNAACAVPSAHPGDGVDDRLAIQDALMSQGCAYLPAGVYDIDSIQNTPPGHHMMIDATGAQLYGDGPGTVLAFRGSTGGLDWEGIHLGGAGSKLHDLSIDTAAISDTTEQTHAVKLLGPATDAEISHVSFDHPIRTLTKSGDCVQLVGYNDGQQEIARVKIHDNDFVHCDRSGVAVHSGTSQLEIVNNRFEDVGNTDVDFEGSGGTSDVLIQHNTFTLSPGLHGVGAIQFQLVARARVTDNVLDGRGIDVFESDDVQIDHNAITLTQATPAPVISVSKDSARTRILDNSLTRDASAGNGAVISAGPHNSGTPDHLEIDDNALVQRTSFAVVSSSGLVGLYVRHNAISYSGAVTNMMSGVLALGSAGTFGIRTTDVHVDSNTFDGPLHAAVTTSGSYFGVGTLDTSGNVATGPTFGIYCDNYASQGGVLGPITSTGDSWPAPSCGPAGFVGVFAAPAPISPPPVSGGGGTADGGGTPPAADTTPPVLSGVSLSRRRAVLRFSSSEAGILSIRIERMRPRPRVRKSMTRAIKAGPGRIALSGRIATKRMKPGRYRLTLTARDTAGNRSKPTARTFTIPRPMRR